MDHSFFYITWKLCIVPYFVYGNKKYLVNHNINKKKAYDKQLYKKFLLIVMFMLGTFYKVPDIFSSCR